MMRNTLHSFIAGILCLQVAAAADGLASASQADRDAAAEKIRSVYQSIPEAKWAPLLEKIQPGLTKEKLLKLPEMAGASEEGADGSGQSHTQRYRLDDEWILICAFRNEGDVLFRRNLQRHMRHVWVEPAPGFTGVWTIYFVNGRRNHEIHYRNGLYCGELTAFRPDGGKAVVQHYDETGTADGEDTGYHPSGKVAYHGRYRNGKRVGAWTHYDEQGNVTSTSVNPDD